MNRQLTSIEKYAERIKTEIIDIRKNFWDDVTVNFDEPTDAAETASSIRQQAEVLSERERSHQYIQRRRHLLRELSDSPYFGRIDFTEEKETKAEKVYLGITSLRDSEDNFLIYDWRAPISSLYYDYSPGPVQYETPGGTVKGVMELKRQYLIRNGQMESVFDTGVTIGDELLQMVLGQQANVQMKNIVSTIQKEQNRVIRNEKKQLLIVQGAAGSGKTSAALQRIAYLLYRYRDQLQAEQILLFSPNPLFSSYISTVLPQLGEENMKQMTFQELLESWIGQDWRLIEDPFEQMEYVLTAKNHPGYPLRLAGIQFKASLCFMEMMEEYLDYLSREGMIFNNVSLRGEILIPAENIKEQFYALDPSLPLAERTQLLARKLLQQLKELEQIEQKKTWVEEEIELLDHETYHQVYKKLQRRKRFSEDTFDDFERERQLLAEMVVGRAFRSLRKQIEKHHFIDLPAIYKQFFTQMDRFPSDGLPSKWREICEQTVEELNRGKLRWEDAAPYLYLKEQLEGLRTNYGVRHVFIDEAQDYSPFQLAVIRRFFPRCRMTVLGDWNQAIFAHAYDNQDGLVTLASFYPTEQTEYLSLSRSYRSTEPIVKFTRELIDGGEKIVPFHRPGKKPSIQKVANEWELGDLIAKRIPLLRKEGYGTIAIICKTLQESTDAYHRLKEKVSKLSLVGKETRSFEKGVIVIPAYLAKGVEFDAVIIYNASEEVYGREIERKLFYTACTRAMHYLELFYMGSLSPFITTVPAHLYEHNA